MCGHDWCSVRISKEIVEFTSGKDENYQWEKAKVTAALTAEQQEILAKRGVLSPDEIHKLASKTRREMVKGTHDRGAEEDREKLSCHSDYVDPETAQRMQAEKTGARVVTVPLDVRPALGIGKEDRVI